jgi:hypothetical protein
VGAEATAKSTNQLERLPVVALEVLPDVPHLVKSAGLGRSRRQRNRREELVQLCGPPDITVRDVQGSKLETPTLTR